MYLEKDKKKYPVPYMIARWIVHSLSPLCLTRENSVLSDLEGLMESIDTFFHPSNQGSWTAFLSQLTFFLTDIFVSRWNREESGELDTPPERRISPSSSGDSCSRSARSPSWASSPRTPRRANY